MNLAKSWFNSKVNKDSIIFELGPLSNPIFPKSEGWNQIAIDHTSRKGLIEKYETHTNVDVSKIEDVDIIWTGNLKDLSEAFEGYRQNNSRIFAASHVLEHMPNPVGFLKVCSENMDFRGRILLALPNKFFTFDYYRPLSTVGELLDNYVSECTKHRFVHVYNHLSQAVRYNGALLSPDSARHYSGFQFAHNLKEAYLVANDSLFMNCYVDVHSWIFSPNSFKAIIGELNDLQLLDLKILEIQEGPGEFYVELGKIETEEHFDRRFHYSEIVKEFFEYSKNYDYVNFYQDNLIKELNNTIDNLNTKLFEMRNSKSWLITKPLRNLTKQTKNYVGKILHQMFQFRKN